MREALETVPGLTSAAVRWDDKTSETALVLDEERLRTLGLTPEAIYAQLPLGGAAVASASQLPTVRALPVRLYFGEPYRSSPATLQLLPVRLPNGESIALGEVARLVQQPGLAMLTTNGMRYTLDVLAYRDTAPISLLSQRARQAASEVLPPGVEMSDEGDATHGERSSRRMLAGLGAGVLLLFGILVPAFGSVSLALLNILILPLSAIGAIWGLLAFDKALALPAILGIVLLFSIVVKNSILLIDFVRERRAEGQDAMSAALGSIRLRYRPVLMTAAATIAGMIPIALERAIGMERLSPLADASIGGLLVGTVLSLFYLPMFYVWVMRRRKTPGESARGGSA